MVPTDSIGADLGLPDIAMLTFFVSLHTVASIMQQIHTIVAFKDVKTKEWENIAANVGSPELNITGGATGLDRVLFYIREWLLLISFSECLGLC